MSTDYENSHLTLAEVKASPGVLLLDFGTSWCGYCRAAAPLIEEAVSEHAQVRHLKIADGPGRRLGRQFGVKLWPTLVVVEAGEEVARVVRPAGADSIRQALAGVRPGG